MSLGAIPLPATAPDPLSEQHQRLLIEEAARGALRHYLDLHVSVSAPTWRELLFGHSRIEFRIPRCPDEALARIDGAPEAHPAHPGAKLAVKLIKDLSDARPRGTAPRSFSPRQPRPPARDALAAWLRRVFLVAAGPAALRLLVAAGYLTASDVEVMEGAYPEGLDDERRGAVEAAGGLTVAAHRNGAEPDLQPWLNDQLLTLMGEHRPTEFFDEIYKSEGAPTDEQQEAAAAGPGPSVGAPPSQVVDQTRPATMPEGR